MFDITAEKAAAAARLAPSGSPEHAIAVQVCRLRGKNPEFPFDLTGIPNWQHVIAEQILEAMLRQALQRAANNRVASPFSAG